ncbi:MAG: polysaccharide deacetylase family protein [Candidatus Heimdallarchaeota archaeon]|nr:MAG: polysaccharide deacetylase family protein [Candidatus Heimdallarchaeota archaeon]
MSWTRHLRTRRGIQIFSHTTKMFRLHMTPFFQLLQRIFNTLDEFDSKFTFPLVAKTAQTHPDVVRWLCSFPHEIAIHGYKHVRYPFLTAQQQALEFERAIQIFKGMKIPFKGFRAPYNAYSEITMELVEKHKFNWDGGIGFHPNYRHGNNFFKIQLRNKRMSSYTCIPLCEWSDDRLIDSHRLSSEKMANILIHHMKKARQIRGVIMYDLHPIRIGQKKYIQCLNSLLSYANKIDAWVPTVSDAVDYWSKNHQWKGDAPVCCLLTGDIDNFTFFDFIRRI